jgi:hypothetical protein
VTLSVTCMTYRPERAAAVLALLRPLAHEIVVALDDRTAPGAEGLLIGVADSVVRYPYAEPVERPWAWLHAQCAGDWVLSIDDDEIPSRALIAAIPELVDARDVTHYWLPCLWLYPTADRYLAARPWSPDYHVRLVLNDPCVRSFPGRMHVPIAVLGPGRYLDEGFYHADLLLKPLAEREQKVARYERLYPGRRAGGRPLNEAYYLPERLDPPTREVPPEDRELVAAALAPEARSPAPSAEARRATRPDIDRHWAGRGLSGYEAGLTLLEPVPALRTGVHEHVFVRVENRGADRWPWSGGGLPEVRLGSRWLRDGRAEEGPRTGLPANLEPGGSAIVPLPLVPPSEPGPYTLEIDLVHEHVRWFEQPLHVEVEVAPRRLVAVLDPGSLEELATTLETLDPEEEAVVLSRDPQALARELGFAGLGRAVPAVSSLLALPRAVGSYRRALVGADWLVVPAPLLAGGRRLPLVAAVTAARSLGLRAATSGGERVSVAGVAGRRVR